MRFGISRFVVVFKPKDLLHLLSTPVNLDVQTSEVLPIRENLSVDIYVYDDNCNDMPYQFKDVKHNMCSIIHSTDWFIYDIYI